MNNDLSAMTFVSCPNIGSGIGYVDNGSFYIVVLWLELG